MDSTIRLGEFTVYFDYYFDQKEQCLKLDRPWSVFDFLGNELLIPDAQFSQEIEEEIMKFLDRKNNEVGVNYL